MISIEEIDNIEDSNLFFYNDLQVLLEAVDNWGDSPEDLDSYFKNVKYYLGGLDYTKSQVNAILRKRKPLLEAWEFESVGILITLLSDYETLSQLYERISKELIRYLNKRVESN